MKGVPFEKTASIWSLVFGFVAMAMNGALFGQAEAIDNASIIAPSQSASLIPYRRMFVPSSDIESIGLSEQEYAVLDLAQISQILKPYGVDNEVARTFQRPPELVSAIFPAKLVGANLVSNSSRLVISRGSVLAERLSLQPWSLAVTLPMDNANGVGKSVDSSILDHRWSSNRIGLPTLDLHTFPPLQATKPLVIPFGWALRSISKSVDKLRFQASIPRCANSCMILSVPPQARLVDSSVPATELKKWQELDDRLSNVDEETRIVIQRQLASEPSDTLWLLEAGGADRLSFSILLGSSNVIPESNREMSDGKIDHLILEQRTEHSIGEGFLTSSSMIELMLDKQNDMGLKIRLDPGCLLKRLTVGNRDVEWSIEDGFIRCDSASLYSLVPNRDTKLVLQVDYLKQLDPTSPNEILLPNMEVAKSYVLKGSTAIRTIAESQLTRVDFSKCRLMDGTDPRRIDLEWWDHPSAIKVSAQSNLGLSTVSAITKLSELEQGIEISIRLTADDFSKSDLLMILPNSWNVSDIVQPITKRTIPWETIASSESTQIRVLRESLQSLGNSMDLILDAPPIAASSDFVLPKEGLLQVRGRSLKNYLLAQNVGEFFDLPSVPLSDLLAIESLSSWERTFVDNPDEYILWPLRGESDITWKRVTPIGNQSVNLDTKVRRAGNSLLRVEHFLNLQEGKHAQQVTIQLPKNANPWHLFRGKSEEEFVRADVPVHSESSQGVEFKLDFSANSPENIWKFETDVALSDSTSIPMPIVAGASRGSHSVALPDEIELLGEVAGASWQLQDDGHLTLILGERADAIRVKLRSMPMLSDLQTRTEAHALVSMLLDQNAQCVGVWEVQIPLPIVKPVRLWLDEKWKLSPDKPKATYGEGSIWFEVDTESNSLSIFPINNPHQSEPAESYSHFSFTSTASDVILSEAWLGLRNSLRIEKPQLYTDLDKPINQSGVLWVAESSCLVAMDSVATSINSRWSATKGFDWWSRSIRQIFFGKETSFDLSSTHPFPKESSGALPSRFWRPIADWTKLEPKSTLAMLDIGQYRRIASMLFLLSTLASGWAIRSRRWLLLVLAGFASCLLLHSDAMQPRWMDLVAVVLSGMAFGVIIMTLQSVALKAMKFSGKQRASMASSWEGSHTGNTAQLQAIKKLSWFFVFLGLSGPIWGQEMSAENIATYNLVFPLDAETELPTEKVFVPESMLAAIRGTPNAPYLLASAKYSLRLGSRNRTVTAQDQLLLKYDFWIGRASEPISFPLAKSSSILQRFVVDEMEQSFGPRLQSKANELVWYPEKTGRRRVEILLSPNLSSPESELQSSGAIWLSQSIDLAVLPASNAVLEIESADVQTQIEIESQGGVSNPIPGRFVVSLGNVTKLAGKFRFPASFGSMPSVASNAPAPVMSLEFFMQAETIRARTVLRIPASTNFEKQFELEADNAWVPVGTSWGNTRLVEVRNASSFWRRRYLFERELNIASVSDEPTQASILWGLRDSTSNLHNVVFAECLDVRVKPLILRYARLSGADWSVDQVNNAEPIISERERLDWPELASIKVNPPATSLRLTSSGAVLKRTPKSDRLQARIASRWMLQHREQALTSRIEIVGAPTSDVLELTLPNGFVVSEARHRLGTFVVCQRPNENDQEGLTSVVQLLGERQLWSNSDISLRAERSVSPESVHITPPWIGIPVAQIMSQTLDLSASEQWTFDLTNNEGQNRTFVGRGVGSAVHSFGRGEKLKWKKRDKTLAGNMSWSTIATDNGKLEMAVLGACLVSNETPTKFCLELPFKLNDSDYWRCDRSASLVPSPYVGRSWIQIDLGSPDEDLTERTWAFNVALPSDFDSQGPSLAEVRIRGVEIKDIVTTKNVRSDDKDKAPPKQRHVNEAPPLYWTATETVESASTNGSLFLWMPYWKSEIDFEVAPEAKLLAVTVNGAPVVSDVNENSCRVIIPPQADRCDYEVVVSWIASDSENVSTLVRPIVEGAEKLFDSDPSFDGSILRRAISVLSKGRDILPGDSVSGSYAEIWMMYWSNRLQTIVQSATQKETNRLDLDEAGQLLGELRSQWPQFSWKSDPLLLTAKRDGAAIESKPQTWTTAFLYALSTFLIFAVSIAGIHRLENQPWNIVMMLGLFAWIVTGSLLLGGLLAGIGLILAIDSRWITREALASMRTKRQV